MPAVVDVGCIDYSGVSEDHFVLGSVCIITIVVMPVKISVPDKHPVVVVTVVSHAKTDTQAHTVSHR